MPLGVEVGVTVSCSFEKLGFAREGKALNWFWHSPAQIGLGVALSDGRDYSVS